MPMRLNLDGPFILDTDHVTLLQSGHPRVVERFNATPKDAVAASIVTYEEQLRIYSQTTHRPIYFVEVRETPRIYEAPSPESVR